MLVLAARSATRLASRTVPYAEDKLIDSDCLNGCQRLQFLARNCHRNLPADVRLVRLLRLHEDVPGGLDLREDGREGPARGEFAGRNAGTKRRTCTANGRFRPSAAVGEKTARNCGILTSAELLPVPSGPYTHSCPRSSKIKRIPAEFHKMSSNANKILANFKFNSISVKLRKYL